MLSERERRLPTTLANNRFDRSRRCEILDIPPVFGGGPVNLSVRRLNQAGVNAKAKHDDR